MQLVVREPQKPCYGMIAHVPLGWINGNSRIYKTAEGAAQSLLMDLRADVIAVERLLDRVKGLKAEHVESWVSTSRLADGGKASQPVHLYEDTPKEVQDRFYSKTNRS